MSKATTVLSRRHFLKKSSGYLALLPATALVGCDVEELKEALDELDTALDNANASDTASVLDDTSSDVPWASGGTQSMIGDYPNPFDEGLGNVCEVVVQNTTEGPCYSDTLAREDISEGLDGLPTRLCFKVVDSQCNPVAGAVVDIWHCDAAGIYSGSGMMAVNFCTGGNAEYISNDWFRGTQTTDADGMVYFSTCFPGWYPSRAVHIHFMVKVDGRTSVTSQVCFDDGLVDEILANEPVYAANGTPDTHNYDDTVFPSSGYESFQMGTRKMSDGAMLAWKALRIS